jgi:UDP-N-acetylmuramate dehydrogenase
MELLVTEKVHLAECTTLQVGGAADYCAEVKTRDELIQALQFAQQKAVPVFVLAGGSNVLFPDEGYRGMVIINTLFGERITEVDDFVEVAVGAGELWDDFVARMCALNYWGIENLSSIPGRVGATPIQNVGAYGVEVSDVITKVTAVHMETLEIKVFDQAECEFGYRDSYFKTTEGKKWVVTEVVFRLSKIATPRLQYADLHSLQSSTDLSASDVRREVIEIRSNKFPDWSKVGTAGSFFKNPIVSAADYQQLKKMYPDLSAYSAGEEKWKLSLGWILDKVCGLKGYCEGQVCLYENQALVLVNNGGTAKNISDFAKSIKKKVFEKTGVHIETEVQFVKN